MALLKIKNLILDVDGVLTTGQMIYSCSGKEYKVFGSDDNDALSLCSKVFNIHAVSGDKNGLSITQARVQGHMHLKLDLVSTHDRVDWIKKHYNLAETIYMGDGIFDVLVFNQVAYSIAPANSCDSALKVANYVTKRPGGSGAVTEACEHILKKFFKINDITSLISKSERIGAWKN